MAQISSCLSNTFGEGCNIYKELFKSQNQSYFTKNNGYFPKSL